MFDIFYLGPKPNLFPYEQAVDSIEQAKELSRTRYCWIVNYLTDYTGFDFLWEPVPWESNQTHVWPSQHQANGGTCLVPKQGGTDFNRNHSVLPRCAGVPVVGIDHGNGLTVDCDYQTRYISDYLGTLKRILSKVDAEYVWVVNSVCDYTNFDFSWHPSEWQNRMLHVFASVDNGNATAFGDTFYIHVPSFLQKSADIKLLEWFETIAFQGELPVPRLAMPRVCYDTDSLVSAVKNYEFSSPLVLFTNNDSVTGPLPVVPLWRETVRTVMPLNSGGSISIVPRDAKNHLRSQLYDYPNIDKKNIHLFDSAPLDIVFIDNGEKIAELNYLELMVTLPNKDHYRVHRSTGVTGRVAAYQAAAKLSTTPWFFAVFAKLRVDRDFDWTWQPDRLQEPKHYIFHAFNPINGLTYGHQAMIAYNKNLVLNNTGVGLDFTLDSAHEVVPILSGTAEYAHSPWMAWRTAFRECLKLKGNDDVESRYRLNKWLTVAKGQPNGQYSIYGAEDAVEYYDSVAGDFDQLKKSYDWAWLSSYALLKRNLTPNQ
jgi:hypothetical protein